MIQDGAGVPWYLAQLKPNGLSLALRNLARQNVTVFAPTETRTSRRAGKFITRPGPVFPGYVFVQIDRETGSFRAINGTRGVSRLVALGSEPSIVPSAVMSALFSRYGGDAEEAPTTDLQPGQLVDIVTGPMANFTAKIEALAPNDRVIVLLDLMGRMSRVTLNTIHVQKSAVD